MTKHSFPADAWKCELCGALAGSLDAKLPCPGAQHDDTLPGDAEKAASVIDWSKSIAETSNP